MNRAGVQVAFQYLHSHPLIIDYIKSESRGKATSIQALGNGIGEFIAMTVLLTIQMNMSVSTGVFLVGLIVLVMSLSVIMMIREPVLKKNKQKPILSSEQEPLLTQPDLDGPPLEHLTVW